MQTISFECTKCRKYSWLTVTSSQTLSCPECSESLGETKSIDNIFDHCPLCQCRQFYAQKDFNQALGCLIMVVGILLVPLTYGLSLPLMALIDWLLYKRTPSVVVCYRCSGEFRGFNIPERFKPFMHHIGVKYDKEKQ